MNNLKKNIIRTLIIAITGSFVFFISNVSFNGCSCSQDEANQSGELSAAEPEKTKADFDLSEIHFIELGAEYCAPCKMMKPVMKRVEETYKGKVSVIFHDITSKDGKKAAQVFGIRVIPTQVFTDKNGKEFFRHEGFYPFEEIQKMLKEKGVE
ncbi:MAG TPA: thioredoxin family protein [Spirochaetota bacterium]|nr:thioredoxin family protein [Spirochaetota bacterium]HQO22103.1 thioredoxin family protein [Spirochaetota bacterium]HQQ23660.1 thioredoxin family protein [Spirochaetota bacterium]